MAAKVENVVLKLQVELPHQPQVTLLLNMQLLYLIAGRMPHQLHVTWLLHLQLL